MRNHILGGLALALLSTTALAQTISGPTGTVAITGTTPVLTDASVAALGSTRLTTSGLVNILSYAGGIAIGDGAAHTVGNAPSGSIFNGVITLAGLAALAIDGTTPFSFLTDSGSVTGPLGTLGSTTNPFTSSTGAYKLTNASVASLDIAWLAIQAALNQGRVYVPAGMYRIGSAINLPLMIPMGFDNNPISGSGVFTMFEGDGARVSYLYAPRDFGAGVPLVSCGDPSATQANGLGRYAGNNGMCSGDVRTLGLFSAGSYYPAANTVGYAMTGFASGARLRTADVESSGFGVNFEQTGDHVLHARLHLFGGAKGLRFASPNGALYGDVQFLELNASGQSIASIAVAPGATIAGHFSAETYISGEYGILGEAATGTAACTPIFNGAIFDHLMSEYIGEATIADDSGFSGGSGSGTYNDANKCRNVQKLDIGEWFNSFDNGKADTTNSGRGRRATVDVAQLDMRVTRLLVDGGSPTPNVVAAPNAAAVPPIAFLNVKGLGTNFGGLDLEGDIAGLISLAGTLPLVTGPNDATQYNNSKLVETGVWSGSLAYLYASAGSYPTSAAGDPMELNSFTTVAPAGTNNLANSPIVGIAMQSGVPTGNVIPIASGGTVRVNTGWSTAATGLVAKSTGIARQLVLVGGAGYTNGTYAWTSSGGGCTTAAAGTVTVTGGALTSFATTNPGAGCTGAPTIVVPSGAGTPTTAGSITAGWPSATALAVTTPQTVGYIGVALNGNNGVSGGGNYLTTRLQGLQ